MNATTTTNPQNTLSRIQPFHFGAAVFVTGVGCVLAWGASRFPIEKGYAILGPQVIPYVVAVFLILIGATLGYQSMTGGFRSLEASAGTTQRGRLGAIWVSGALIAMAMLITRVGFVMSASLLFAMAARGFGSKQPLRDFGIGVALTLPVYWVFTSGLGVSLPALVNAWI